MFLVDFMPYAVLRPSSGCRLQPGYDPNTRHCLHGLDADLVMLALASHDPYFTISRDHIDFKNPAQKGRNKVVVCCG